GDPRGEDPYGAATIRLSLRPGVHAEALVMTVTFSAEFDGDHWIVGVTGDEFLVDVVAGMTLAVNDMSCPGPLTPNTNLHRMHVSVRSASEIHATREPMPFRKASVNEIVEITGERRLASLGDIRWFLAPFDRDGDRSTLQRPQRVT